MPLFEPKEHALFPHPRRTISHLFYKSILVLACLKAVSWNSVCLFFSQVSKLRTFPRPLQNQMWFSLCSVLQFWWGRRGPIECGSFRIRREECLCPHCASPAPIFILGTRFSRGTASVVGLESSQDPSPSEHSGSRKQVVIPVIFDVPGLWEHLAGPGFISYAAFRKKWARISPINVTQEAGTACDSIPLGRTESQIWIIAKGAYFLEVYIAEMSPSVCWTPAMLFSLP